MSQPPDEPTAPMSTGPASGDVLGGRYVLRAVLGRGGMATVWRAHDPVLHRDVAVKIFDHASALPDASARAAVEVRMLAGLNHPNLVSVHDAAGSSPGSFDHLVMELVEGRSLREQLDTGPLPPARVAALGVELAAGLEHVHDRGIVHRDLKPANVLLEATPRGDRAKIADFGVARLLEGVALTMVGTTVGTANYLSPEQATGADAGPASDIYSLGLVLLECLTGVMAYPGHGVGAAAARLHRPPDVPVALGPGWTDLLRAMIALDPAARPDATQVGARLARLTGTADPSTQVIPPVAATAPLGATAAPGGTAVLPAATPAAPPRRRRRGLLVAVGLVAAGILALGLIVGLGGGSDDGPADGPAGPASTAPAATPTTAAPTTAATTAPTTAAPTTTAPSTSSPRPAPSTVARTTAPAGPPQPVPPGQDKKDKNKDKKPGKP